MIPWIERPVISVDLNTPIKRRFQGFSAEVHGAAGLLLLAIRNELPSEAQRLAPLVRLRTAGRFQKEAVALASMADTNWKEITVASICYELVLSIFGCSTMALATPEGPVLARNMDWWPEDALAQATYTIRFEQNNTLRFATAGWPGSLGVATGLSGNGFAVALNAVTSPEGIAKTGYPVMLHIRRVLEDATSFEDAVKRLAGQRLAASALFTVVGCSNNERVVIERTPSRNALRWAEGDQPLVATNDYRLLFKPTAHAGAEIYETTCARFETLRSCLMESSLDASSDEALLYVLTNPGVIQGITAQHVIIRPSRSSIRSFVPRRLIETEPMNFG